MFFFFLCLFKGSFKSFVLSFFFTILIFYSSNNVFFLLLPAFMLFFFFCIFLKFIVIIINNIVLRIIVHIVDIVFNSCHFPRSIYFPTSLVIFIQGVQISLLFSKLNNIPISFIHLQILLFFSSCPNVRLFLLHWCFAM